MEWPSGLLVGLRGEDPAEEFFLGAGVKLAVQGQGDAHGAFADRAGDGQFPFGFPDDRVDGAPGAGGRGRLSYPRAEYLFKQASAPHDPHGTGWTLHQLRHSALRHLAASGRSAPELQAKSRHKHLATLGHYVRLGEETSARITADNDPLARRRAR